MQASKMRFLRNIKVVTMFDKVCYSAVQESLNNYLLLFPDRKILLKWFCLMVKWLKKILLKWFELTSLLNKFSKTFDRVYIKQTVKIYKQKQFTNTWEFIFAAFKILGDYLILLYITDHQILSKERTIYHYIL